MNYRIIPATFDHIAPIAAAMRGADRRELAASHGHSPEQALKASLAWSPLVWTCFVHDEPAFMWGVGATNSVLGRTGAPWLLATEAIRGVERQFSSQSRSYVQRMQDLFPRLENYVHKDNIRSRRWLAWCGFHIEPEPQAYGVNGELFYRFWKGEE